MLRLQFLIGLLIILDMNRAIQMGDGNALLFFLLWLRSLSCCNSFWKGEGELLCLFVCSGRGRGKELYRVEGDLHYTSICGRRISIAFVR